MTTPEVRAGHAPPKPQSPFIHAVLGGSGGLYLVSLASPSYAGAPGYLCLLCCFAKLRHFDTSGLGGGFYYPAFVVTNLLFPWLSYVALSPHRKVGWWHGALALAAIGHVASWFALNLLPGDPLGIEKIMRESGVGISRPEGFTHLECIDFGYYLWFGAYGLLLLALVLKRKAAKQADIGPGVETDGLKPGSGDLA